MLHRDGVAFNFQDLKVALTAFVLNLYLLAYLGSLGVTSRGLIVDVGVLRGWTRVDDAPLVFVACAFLKFRIHG